MDEYNFVIAEYDRLCEERNNNKFWAENITEATQNISSLIVWQNFYAYMGDSRHKYSDVWKQSLGEQVDEGLTFQEGDQKFKTITVQNGDVTYIKMTPVGQNLDVTNKTDDGEQVDRISQTIQEEKSDPLPQGSDEIGKF